MGGGGPPGGGNQKVFNKKIGFFGGEGVKNKDKKNLKFFAQNLQKKKSFPLKGTPLEACPMFFLQKKGPGSLFCPIFFFIKGFWEECQKEF